MPTVRCSNCGKALRVKTELLGKRVKCPGCKAVIAIPAPPDPGEQQQGPEASATYQLDLEPSKAAPLPLGMSAPSADVCGGCGRPLPPGAVRCANCGLDLRTEQGLTTKQLRNRGGIKSFTRLLLFMLVVDFVGFAVVIPLLVIALSALTGPGSQGWGGVMAVALGLGIFGSFVASMIHVAFVRSTNSQMQWAMVLVTGIVPGVLIGSLGDLFAWLVVRPRCAWNMQMPYFWTTLLEKTPPKHRRVVAFILAFVCAGLIVLIVILNVVYKPREREHSPSDLSAPPVQAPADSPTEPAPEN